MNSLQLPNTDNCALMMSHSWRHSICREIRAEGVFKPPINYNADGRVCRCHGYTVQATGCHKEKEVVAPHVQPTATGFWWKRKCLTATARRPSHTQRGKCRNCWFVSLTRSWHVHFVFTALADAPFQKENKQCTQTEARHSAAANCVGAWAVRLISVPALEYLLVHIQAGPQQRCVGTVAARSLVSGWDPPLCGPGLLNRVHVHSVQLSEIQTKCLFIVTLNLQHWVFIRKHMRDSDCCRTHLWLMLWCTTAAQKRSALPKQACPSV